MLPTVESDHRNGLHNGYRHSGCTECLLVLDEVETHELEGVLPEYKDDDVKLERRRVDLVIYHNSTTGVDLSLWYERLLYLEEELDRRGVTWDPFEGTPGE